MSATETHATVMEIINSIVDMIHDENRMVTDDNLSLIVAYDNDTRMIPITKDNIGIQFHSKTK
jgi:hypothetical protein